MVALRCCELGLGLVPGREAGGTSGALGGLAPRGQQKYRNKAVRQGAGVCICPLPTSHLVRACHLEPKSPVHATQALTTLCVPYDPCIGPVSWILEMGTK